MLFNAFGYRWVSNYFDQKATAHFVSLIEENNYNESELISIKTPINLPYYANNPKFERVDGEMVIKGVVYQYVQRRVYNDSLEILVLPNQDRLHIKNAREDFYKLAQELDQSGASKKSIPIGKAAAKLLSFDYIGLDAQWSFNNIIITTTKVSSDFVSRLTSNYLSVQGPPPKNIA